MKILLFYHLSIILNISTILNNSFFKRVVLALRAREKKWYNSSHMLLVLIIGFIGIPYSSLYICT